MEDDQEIKEFPDVTQKLTAPKKISAFEKERQAAEAKRQRAEAENAAALKAFENSFGGGDADDGDALSNLADRREPPRGPPRGPRGGGRGYADPYAGRYGGPPSGPRSGPGSLGPVPGPPPSLKRKRMLEEARELQEARREASLLTEDDSSNRDSRSAKDLPEDNIPKPTVQLSMIPPRWRTEHLEELLKRHDLEVHSVRFIDIGPSDRSSKRGQSAIATLTTETSTTQIESAVSALKDKYLSCGYYLSITRHLSSAALHPRATSAMAHSSEPFGAQVPKETGGPTFRNAPPPASLEKRFPPPNQYDSRSRPSHQPRLQTAANVPVHAPLDANMMRAIHIVADAVMSTRDNEEMLLTEATLMNLPAVQMDERFAFLYETQSPAAIYYRYLLWTSSDPEQEIREKKRRAHGMERVHYDCRIEWTPPQGQIPFPNLTSLAQAVDDLDYHSTEEESDNDVEERPFNLQTEATRDSNESRRFSLLKRARLIHLLSRLPPTISTLRKGDIARITNFVINHAGQAEEIVDILLLNIKKPFSLSLASKYEDPEFHAQKAVDGKSDDDEDSYEPDDNLPTFAPPPPTDPKVNSDTTTNANGTNEDPSNAKLIALYVISDILSAASTAGARSAWKYRTLFEAGFRACRSFEHLGRLEKELGWGKIKSEQWKRRIKVILDIWEGWSAFSGEVQAEIKQQFYEPPLTANERIEEAKRKLEEKRAEVERVKARFKKVEPAASAPKAEEDVDGVPMAEEDIDGVPMKENDVDGVPMEDDLSDDNDATLASDKATTGSAAPPKDKREPVNITDIVNSTITTRPGRPTAPFAGFKKRMRAEDMFASDEE